MLILLAAIQKVHTPRPEYPILAAVVLVVIAALGIAYVAWMKREAQDEEPVSEDDMLKEFERAYWAGEIDKAEFERICASLNRKGPKVEPPRPPSPAEKPVVEAQPAPEPPPPAEGA